MGDSHGMRYIPAHTLPLPSPYVMTQINPYAAPKSAFTPVSNSDGIWRLKKTVILRRDSDLPDRCIKCNAPALPPYKKQKLYWHHPALYLLFLLNIIVYLVIALLIRKTAELHVGLCEEHRKQLLRGRVIGYGGFVLVLALTFVSIVEHSTPLGIATGCLALVWIIATIAVNRLLTPQKIDKDYVRIKGCGPLFLDSLPEFPGGKR